MASSIAFASGPARGDPSAPLEPTRPARRFPATRGWLPIAGAVAAVLALVLLVDWAEVGRMLARSSPGLVILAALLLVADRVLMSAKWQMLLRALDVRLGLLENWRIYSTAAAAAHLAPLSVAADALRVLWLQRHGAPPAAVGASIVLERGMAVLVSAVLSGLALAGLFVAVLGLEILFWPMLVAIAATPPTLLVVACRDRLAEALGRLVHRVLGRRLASFRAALGELVQDRPMLGRVMALTVLRQLLVVVANLVLARAVGLPVEPLVFAAAYLAALLVARLPLSVEGIGLFEGALAVILGTFGVTTAATVAYALLGRALTMAALLPGVLLPMLMTWTGRPANTALALGRR